MCSKLMCIRWTLRYLSLFFSCYIILYVAITTYLYVVKLFPFVNFKLNVVPLKSYNFKLLKKKPKIKPKKKMFIFKLVWWETFETLLIFFLLDVNFENLMIRLRVFIISFILAKFQKHKKLIIMLLIECLNFKFMWSKIIIDQIINNIRFE